MNNLRNYRVFLELGVLRFRSVVQFRPFVIIIIILHHFV